jgi:hypothetical protein
MAEAVGLAVSIVGLATTFDSVIKCFEYIHLRRTFGTDFEDCLFKLDNAKLRLSRWGEAVGLSQVDEDTKSLSGTNISEADIPKAAKLLGAILAGIERVEKLEAKFRDRKEPTDQSLDTLSPQERLDPGAFAIHANLTKMAKKRQNRLSPLKKAKWAI